jgi:hypothetical protein
VGTHTHWPFWHAWFAPKHVPHEPPHPSSPQTLPVQLGVQHQPLTHFWPAWQMQSELHVEQVSPSAASHTPLPHDGFAQPPQLVLHASTQRESQEVQQQKKSWLHTQVSHAQPPQPAVFDTVQPGRAELSTHRKLLHVFPAGHVPQDPPQPSVPHCLPAHCLLQGHLPLRHAAPSGQEPQETVLPQPSDAVPHR